MADVLYAAKGSNQTTSDLYTVNTASPGSPTAIGAIGFGITGLAFDPTDGTLYGATNTNSGSNPNSLITIDPVTGTGTLVGAFTGGERITDLACDSAGNLYGFSGLNDGFFSINKATGAVTNLGGAEHAQGGGLSFDSGDVLYVALHGLAASQDLSTVNTSNGALTPVTTFSGSPNGLNGMAAAAAFDSGDVLWAIDTAGTAGTWHLVTINTATAVITDEGTMPDRFDALAWSVTVTPTNPPPEGISLAFDDPTLEPNPVWTRLDDPAARVTRVFSYSIERGRRFELDRTDGGRATISINDVDGTLDPTNSSGPYYGLIEPLIQAAISRWNPVLEEWQLRFRGFVEDFDYAFDPSQRVNRLTISLVDIFEILNAIEMQPGEFGDTPPTSSQGQVFFDNANVDDRIFQIYRDAGLPDEFFVVFSGNVGLYETVYSAGESALAAIQEAVDAEFPGVSNFYPDRFGRGVFHGRLAKFDPSGTAASTTPDRWDYQEWKVGDGTAVHASISDTAQIRAFGFNRGLAMVRNQALATPVFIRDEDVAGQLATDPTSIGKFGIRSWSAQNLLTKTGLLDGSAANTETARFATYIVDNYKDAHNRIPQVTIKPLRPTDARAAALWKLACQGDIADSMEVTVASPGGGGFNLEPCFIEGVREEVTGRIFDGVTPGDEGYDNFTITFDLSPQALFTSNPFPIT